MAEAIVSSVLKMLADVAVSKAQELCEVIDQIEPINSDLRFIRAFLKDADRKQNTNESVKEWVKQVREVAFQIEDAIDTFLVEIQVFNRWGSLIVSHGCPFLRTGTKNLLRQLLSSMKCSNLPETYEDLQMEVERCLTGKRYLIVLDDVWTVNLWEHLKTTLPHPNNASRVLITTRIVDVARAADCNTPPFKPNYLNNDESLALLFRKAFQQQIQPDDYPTDLRIIGERLIKRCGGLPLALAVLGGILSRRDRNSAAWGMVETTSDWHNPDGENCSQILALSYEDLSYELKPCFLYYASFPEDYEISVKHITRMWVAEGFIANDGAGTLEERAEYYLEELVQRSLVLVHRKTEGGRPKICRMHDLLRDLAIHEAKNNNFLTVFSQAENVDGRVDITMTRRAALQFDISEKYEHLSPKTRSLICFGNHQMLNYQGFRLLRVLNFEAFNNDKAHFNLLEGKSAIHKGLLECLIHLRFLGFRYCDNYFGLQSASFRNNKNLETLDLTQSNRKYDRGTRYINDYPNDSLWTVPNLRHVITSDAIPGPSQWDDLKNIQTLKWVKFIKFPVLLEKINLRKLGVEIAIDPDEWKQSVTPVKPRCHVKGESSLSNPPILESTVKDGNAWEALNGLLKWTDFLTSLSVKLSGEFLMFGSNGTSDLPCHKKIQKLDLVGKWAIPLNNEMLPINLVKLILRKSKLEEDPMPILERLKSLRRLVLSSNSYTGTKLSCSGGGFPSLENLTLYELKELNEWKIEKGAMPILNDLILDCCNKLCILPDLQNVPNVRKLTVSPNWMLYDRLQLEDLYKIKHIPSVIIEEPLVFRHLVR